MHRRLKSTYDFSEMCTGMKDFRGRYLSLDRQEDVNEFFNLFVERLGTCLRGTAGENLLEEIFGGVFSSEITCVQCLNASKRVEKFHSLNLLIKGKDSLQASLKAFTATEDLKGDNAYECEACKTKVKAEKKTSFRLLPNYLMVVLNRFEYNQEARTREKINDYYEFPTDLDMREYLNGSSIAEEEKNSALFPNEYCSYKLKAVVVHSGSADCGHYISLIREESKWFQFDDSKVSEFDSKNLAEAAFGGKVNASSEISLNSSHEVYTRTANAYLVIYERAVFYDIKKLNDTVKSASRSFKNAEISWEGIKLSPELKDKLIKKLGGSNEVHLFHTKSFYKLMKELMVNYQKAFSMPSKGVVSEKKEEEGFIGLWKLISMFLFANMLRREDHFGISLYGMLGYYKEMLSKSLEASTALLELFAQPRVIEDLLLNCPLSSTRLFCYSSIITAFKEVYPEEQKRVNELLLVPPVWLSIVSSSSDKVSKCPVTLLLVTNLLNALLRSQDKAFKDVSYLLVALYKAAEGVRKLMRIYRLVDIGFSLLLGFASTAPTIPQAILEKTTLLKLRTKVNELPKKLVVRNMKNYRYFLHLLSLLFSDYYSSKTANNPDNQLYNENDPLNYFFSKNKAGSERSLEEASVKKLFNCAEGRLASNSVATILSYICSSSCEIANECIEFLFRLIGHSPLIELNKYVAALESIVSIKDDHVEDRFKTFMNFFVLAMGGDLSDSYITMTHLIDTFIHIAIKCPEVHTAVKNSPENIRAVKNWLSANAYPSNGVVSLRAK